jgi:phosphoglycolate phosphatase-like HAD superfamily hydrolase
MQTGPRNAMPLDLVIFDVDEVLCRYDRPLRLRRLAALSARKPEPQVYQLFLARLGVAPQAALMVDDDEDNVAGAEFAGLRGHLFDGIAGLKKRLAAFGIGTT